MCHASPMKQCKLIQKKTSFLINWFDGATSIDNPTAQKHEGVCQPMTRKERLQSISPFYTNIHISKLASDIF